MKDIIEEKEEFLKSIYNLLNRSLELEEIYKVSIEGYDSEIEEKRIVKIDHTIIFVSGKVIEEEEIKKIKEISKEMEGYNYSSEIVIFEVNNQIGVRNTLNIINEYIEEFEIDIRLYVKERNVKTVYEGKEDEDYRGGKKEKYVYDMT